MLLSRPSSTARSFLVSAVKLTGTLAPALALMLALISPPSLASESPASPAAGSNPQRTVDPLALVRRASHNELAATIATGGAMKYKLRKVDEKGTTTKEIVETKDGGVARLIAINDRPLNPDEQAKENERLHNLFDHPEVQEHRKAREKEDSDRADKMVRLLPDAFIYQYAGMVRGPNGPCYRLTFVPNPKFNPPDREAEVYHGMAGELWIDKSQERLAKMDAHLIADVDFGWGILGRLYKGGTITVEQADVGHRHWEATHMRLKLTGKALMVKSLNFTTTEDSSDFQPVPKDIGYRDAIHMLDSASAAPAASKGR